MLTLEELAIMLSLDGSPNTRTYVAFRAQNLYGSARFDQRVALSTIDKLIAVGYIAKDIDGILSVTESGWVAVSATKSGISFLLRKLVFV
jgi:hypothetical protein